MVDSPSMGCKVPHRYCSVCGEQEGPPCEHVREARASAKRVDFLPSFTSLSFVSFTDESIDKIAKHAGVSADRIREYLRTDEQNPELFRAVESITGCCPVGKRS